MYVVVVFSVIAAVTAVTKEVLKQFSPTTKNTLINFNINYRNWDKLRRCSYNVKVIFLA